MPDFEIKYTELYKKLKDFTIECSNFFKESLKDISISMHGAPYSKGEEIPPYYFVQEEDLIRHIYEKYSEIHKLGSCKKLYAYIVKQKTVWWQSIFEFLNFYYSLVKKFEFDPEIFDLLYLKFEKYNYEMHRSDIFICPLQNFELDVKEIILEENLVIREISPPVVWKIRQSSLTIGDPSSIKFAIYRVFNYEKTDIKEDFSDLQEFIKVEEQRNEIRELFHNVVSALRLFKKGDLGMPLRYFSVPLDWGVSGGMAVHHSLFAPFFGVGERYTLKDDEISEFQQFWKDIRKSEFSKKVRVAIDRFNYLYERKNPEDNIIDCMIALEALFGAESKTSMMIALKTAFLLSENKDEVKDIYRFLKRTYDIRSDIVHGRTVSLPIQINDKEYGDLKEVVKEAQALLRLSIRSYLNKKTIKEKEKYYKLIEMLEFKEGREVIERVFEIAGK